jgi:uncharacterized iron-regulated protein
MAEAAEVGREGLGYLPPADVVILGEVHDNPYHHEAQAVAVAAVQPRALVFEMLTPAQATAATAENRGDRAALEAALGWAGSGWPDFAMYHPIFTAAPEAEIFGAGVPREEVRRAMAEGADAAMGPDAALFGLDLALDPDDLTERVEEQAVAHCQTLPLAMLPGMVEAQRLRDAVLARAALAALDATGGPVAVITGNGHARRDRGVPAYLELARPGLSVLALGQLEATPDVAPPYDLWHVTPAAEREDHCARLR